MGNMVQHKQSLCHTSTPPLHTKASHFRTGASALPGPGRTCSHFTFSPATLAHMFARMSFCASSTASSAALRAATSLCSALLLYRLQPFLAAIAWNSSGTFLAYCSGTSSTCESLLTDTKLTSLWLRDRPRLSRKSCRYACTRAG